MGVNKKLIQKLSPQGVNAVPSSYMVIMDGGKEYFVRAMTLTSLPKTAVFGVTFPDLMRFPNVDCSVRITPANAAKMIRTLDNKLQHTEADYIAENNRNRQRRLQQLYNDTLQWQSQLERGEICLYEVKFIFLLYAESLRELETVTKRFVSKVRGSMEISACYCGQVEAYMSTGPYNTFYKIKNQLLQTDICPTHILDDASLSTIFPHTDYSYSHDTGIPVGVVHNSGEPFLHDCFHSSHDGYSQIFAGPTGTGKSLTVKVSAARYRELYRTRFACIDTKPVDGRGEYSILCENLQGVNYELSARSKNKLNLFEVSTEPLFVPERNLWIDVLNLSDKVLRVTQTIENLIYCGQSADTELSVAIETVVRFCVSQTYDKFGIHDGDPESLLEADGTPKKQPIMSDFFLVMLKESLTDSEMGHKRAYGVALDSISGYLDTLYYDTTTFERVPAGTAGETIKMLPRTRPYFDGESTAHYDKDTPFINFDLSALPEGDQPVAQLVTLEYILENIVKHNASGKHGKKLVLIIDEAHRFLRRPKAAALVDDAFRTVRTKLTSIWLIVQSVRDIVDLTSTESIVKNSASMYLFKHAQSDLRYLIENIGLTAEQARAILTLGGNATDPKEVRKGECCVIDNKRPLFVDVKYLEETEWLFAESDRDKRRKKEAATW